MKYNHFKKHIVPFSENAIRFHDYSYDDFIPPLRVDSAGKSRWGFDHFYQRSDSEIFGIEQVCAGNLIFVQNKKEYLVKSGEVFLLRKLCAHRYSVGPAGFVHKRFISLNGLALEIILRGLGLWETDHVVLDNPHRVARIFKQLYAIFSEKEPGFTEKASIAAYELLCELGRRQKTRYPASVSRAMEFINRNLDTSIMLCNICDAAHTSSTHLNRLFKEYVGNPPLAYHRQQRFSWAQHLLTNTSMSIKEIAGKIGFDDALYFSAQFKKETELSPREFRKAGRT